jgi:hypothetical protein
LLTPRFAHASIARDAGALGADADPLWRAVAQLLTEPQLSPSDFGYTEALVAAASLRRSSSETAREQPSLAAAQVTDPHTPRSPRSIGIGTIKPGRRSTPFG